MVKKIYVTAILFLITSAVTKAQVVVTQLALNPVQFTLQDMWDMSIINNGEEATVYLKGVLNDENGKQILEAVSTEFILGKGIKNFHKAEIATQSAYFNPNHPNAGLIEQFKNLPYGEYSLCVFIYNKETNEQLTESCIEHTSQPITPPILVTPDYCSEVYTKYPFFSWLAPSPEIKGQTVYYSFKLVEVYSGQSDEDAVQRNLAVIFEDNLTQTSLQYPSTAPPLDSTKKYAWQVQAKVKKYNNYETQPNNNSFRHVGISEVWCLYYKKPELPPIITEKTAVTYAVPKLYEDAEITVTNILYLSFVEEYTAGQMNYIIYDNNGQTVDFHQALQINKGDNRYDINLKQTTLFTHNRMYKMVIKGNNRETWYLKFRYMEQ